jgi:UDP-sugar transporter A1/2/3
LFCSFHDISGVLKETYSSTEVVLVGEIIKMVISGYLSVVDRSETDASGSGLSKLLWLVTHSRKIIILVVLYSIANIMSYYALARVDASVYTVLLQLKIFSTAAFAVILLGRNLSSAKWRALLLLVLGCILVASPTFNKAIDCALELGGKKGKGSSGTDDESVSAVETFFGLVAVLAMVTISGYSAIYFEQML